MMRRRDARPHSGHFPDPEEVAGTVSSPLNESTSRLRTLAVPTLLARWRMVRAK